MVLKNCINKDTFVEATNINKETVKNQNWPNTIKNFYKAIWKLK